MDPAVLIVDDQPSISGFFATVFRKLGFVAFEAEDNESALAIARDHPVQLITTDIIRPYQSGIEFIKRVRADPELRNIQIVVITGSSSKEIELEAWRSGANDFFAKPIGAEQIILIAEKARGQTNPMDISLLTFGVESRDLDYKEQIDLDSNTSRAELARDVIAMANAGGGRLIVGIAERDNTFLPVGVPASDLPRYETTKLNDCLRKYVSSTVQVRSRVVRHKGLGFAFIEVDPALDTIALAATLNEKAGLYPGRIYVRTHDGRTSELSDPLELRKLIDRLVENRLKHYQQ
jgi:CheY-like chemotaxis protein